MERDTLAGQFLADVFHRRQSLLPGKLFWRGRKQQRFQPIVVQIESKKPAQPVRWLRSR
jgi:hypothetical protein